MASGFCDCDPADRVDPSAPGGHHQENQRAQQQRDPAALPNLQQVGTKKRQVDQQKHAAHQQRDDRRPAPDIPHGVEQQRRGQQHRGRDSGAVRSGKLSELPKLKVRNSVQTIIIQFTTGT